MQPGVLYLRQGHAVQEHTPALHSRQLRQQSPLGKLGLLIPASNLLAVCGTVHAAGKAELLTGS